MTGWLYWYCTVTSLRHITLVIVIQCGKICLCSKTYSSESHRLYYWLWCSWRLGELQKESLHSAGVNRAMGIQNHVPFWIIYGYLGSVLYYTKTCYFISCQSLKNATVGNCCFITFLGYYAKVTSWLFIVWFWESFLNFMCGSYTLEAKPVFL